MVELLSDDAVARRLAEVPGWEHAGRSIRRERVFPSFVEAVAFVNRVAMIAEAQNHHPDIHIRWRRVTLVLTTHDAGGLTARDFAAAAAMEAVINPAAADGPSAGGP